MTLSENCGTKPRTPGAVFGSKGCGAGLRSKHYSFIQSEWPAIDWFEAVTENYMDTGGRPLKTLESIRAHYPVALHGVSLSIGSADPLGRRYLQKLKELAAHIDPFVVSDHLCWTGVDGQNLHDLLPLPLTEEALEHVVRRVGEVQEFLGRPILLENISTYVTYKHSTMPEWEFLRETARRSGCGILLDLNNIYVNSVNHRFDPFEYLAQIPARSVGQFHLAGHTDKGAYLFDTHSSTVTEAVWKLYAKALELYGQVSTLIEWDEEIPDFSKLSAEVEKAKAIYVAAGSGPTNVSPMPDLGPGPVTPPTLVQTQREMRDRILSHNHGSFSTVNLNPQGGASGAERMAVYADAYVSRLAEALGEIYEAVKHLMGDQAFVQLCESYIDAHPSRSYNLNSVGENLAEHLEHSRFAEALPFLPDLARLEWRIARAFHASEGPPFEASQLGDHTEEEWEKLRVYFQPSVSVVVSRWPIADIWNARKTPLSEIRIELESRPQQVLVYREGLNVRCQVLDPAQAEAVANLQKGEDLGRLCERLDDRPVGDWFGAWASRGLIADVR